METLKDIELTLVLITLQLMPWIPILHVYLEKIMRLKLCSGEINHTDSGQFAREIIVSPVRCVTSGKLLGLSISFPLYNMG